MRATPLGEPGPELVVAEVPGRVAPGKEGPDLGKQQDERPSRSREVDPDPAQGDPGTPDESAAEQDVADQPRDPQGESTLAGQLVERMKQVLESQRHLGRDPVAGDHGVDEGLIGPVEAAWQRQHDRGIRDGYDCRHERRRQQAQRPATALLPGARGQVSRHGSPCLRHQVLLGGTRVVGVCLHQEGRLPGTARVQTADVLPDDPQGQHLGTREDRDHRGDRGEAGDGGVTHRILPDDASARSV